MEANVTFGRARSFFTCDINVHAGRGLTLRGEGEAGDANAAFDDAAEHIATRLRRYRRRVNEHHRAPASRERRRPRAPTCCAPSRTEPAPSGEAAVTAAHLRHGDRRDADRDRRLTRGRRGDAHGPGGPAGADVPQSATGELNVVYRRSDGNIGWIDPARG